MSFHSSEQVLHDRVNLARLVRRLEKTVASQTWPDAKEPSLQAWLSAIATLQKVNHARQLLKNVEFSEDLNPTDMSKLEELRRSINQLQGVLQDIVERVAPEPKRPPPVLPSLPLPVNPTPEPPPYPEVTDSSELPEAAALLPVEGTSPIPTQDLLLSPSDTAPPSHRPPVDPNSTLFPPNFIPASTSASSLTGPGPSSTQTRPTPAFLQNSAALQEEMSAQLAQMATQLKRNAQHFSSSLEKDKTLVQETQEKLERNFDVMSKERVRLRDHRSKSWGTTWIVVLSMLVAVIGFLLTFFVIRFT